MNKRLLFSCFEQLDIYERVLNALNLGFEVIWNFPEDNGDETGVIEITSWSDDKSCFIYKEQS